MHCRATKGAAVSALGLTLVLAGCSSGELTQGWFAKPIDVFGRNSGYSYSELQVSRKDRPITANDLVEGNGSCPSIAASMAAATPPPSGPDGSGAPPQIAPGPPSLLGQPVALGMSECDIVYRAGQPASVQVGANPNGERTAVLTFNTGVRAGLYRFQAGRLMEVQRTTEEPAAPPPKVAKKKKKPVKRQQATKE